MGQLTLELRIPGVAKMVYAVTEPADHKLVAAMAPISIGENRSAGVVTLVGIEIHDCRLHDAVDGERSSYRPARVNALQRRQSNACLI
jgi:hypothetical protein